jgi:hypothetical protein
MICMLNFHMLNLSINNTALFEQVGFTILSIWLWISIDGYWYNKAKLCEGFMGNPDSSSQTLLSSVAG